MTGPGGALMVCGATSGAGKSTVAAALCRSWARQGKRVAPFKAQNMSNHTAVTADGGEVGRAQAMQARACGVELDRRMNPILLKPTTQGRSHVVVLGDDVSLTGVADYGATAEQLRPVVLDALTSLRSEFDWLVAEGAGGAAEINLLDRDLVNLPLARAGGLPALLVVDIDRGGAFAAAHGTIDLLPDALRAPIAGIIFNQFRGDASLLTDGITELERRCRVPVLGVLPHLGDGPMLGGEDSLDVQPDWHREARSLDPVRVAAIRLPHLANPSDLDPLSTEPDVELRWVTYPSELATADVILLPGSRATVADLEWLRTRGLASAIQRSTASIVGICAGYQMLGRHLHDDIESGLGTVEGLGLLAIETTFEQPKIVRRSHGAAGTFAVDGYQIHHGRVSSEEQPWFCLDGAPEGSIGSQRRIFGTSLHGLFDSDAFRRHFLGAIADTYGRRYAPSTTSFARALDHQHDRLADWLEADVDVEKLIEIAAEANTPEGTPGW